MARTIDERIVSMAFENQKFEAGVAQTMQTLGKLNTALGKIGNTHSLGDIEKAASKITLQQPASAIDKLKAKLSFGKESAEGFGSINQAANKVTLDAPAGAVDKLGAKISGVGATAADSFGNVEKAAGQVSFGGMSSAIDGIAQKFSVLEIAAGTALGNIATKLGGMGAQQAKGLTLGPVISGYKEYELKLNSIQTILANTKASGTTLKDVSGALTELNHYADRTIYNFGQMAKNIGTFTAAGVDLDTATSSIKGIANLAALSGTNSEQASRAMYQLSQAISSGRVSLMDWKSVENAGMGGAVFQRNLAETAVAMGVLDKNAVKLTGKMKNVTINGQSFRNSIMAKPGEQSWLDSKVLTASLGTFTGDMKDAELAALGFSEAQIKAIQDQAKTAVEAATKVKTFTQLMSTTKESIESGWAETWEIVFGDFEEARKLWTGVSNVTGGFIQNMANARNKMMEGWDKLGGRKSLIQGVKNGFQALLGVIKPITQAFRDIFPRKTGEDLYKMTENFRKFMGSLKPSAEVMEGIRRTARGLFAVLHIGWEVVKGLIGVIGDLLSVAGGGAGGFLSFTGSIGDFLVSIDEALTKGGLLKAFFEGLSEVLKIPLTIIGNVAAAIGGMFAGVDSGAAGKVAGNLDKVSIAAGPLKDALRRLEEAWKGFKNILRQAKDMVSPWLEEIGEQMKGVSDVLANAFKTANFDNVMAALQTGFIGGIFLAIKKAIGGAGDSLGESLGGLNRALGHLTKHMTVMQQNVKANIVLKIASAIGILAAATYALSKVPAEDLGKAMLAISVGLAQLMGAMKLMLMGGGLTWAALAAIPIISLSLIGMATALVIFAGAVKILSTLKWEEIAKGMVGILGSLGAMAVAILPLALVSPLLTILGPSLILIAVAMNILAFAVKQFGQLKWGELVKGMAGVFGSLFAMAVGLVPLALLSPALLILAPALLVLSVALNLLAGAIRLFGDMDISTIAKGILGAATSLLLIGAAMWAIPPHAALLGAGLLIVAAALAGIGGALKIFGGMGIGEMAKGIIGMGLALLTLAVGLTAMIAALPGAAALMIAAAALAVLAPTMAFLGALNWGTIFKGLAAIGLALMTLSIAGSVAAPGLVLLGLALLPLAGVLLLVATATLTFAKAIEIMASGGAKGIGVFLAAVTGFVALLPRIVIDFIKGLVSIVEQMAKVAPLAMAAIVKILRTIIDAVIQLTPDFALAISMLIGQFALVAATSAPKLVAAGWKILQAFLSGLQNNIGELTTKVVAIVTHFLEALTAQAPRLIAAGATFLVTWISGITSKLPSLVGVAIGAIVGFITAIASNIHRVYTAGAKLILGFLRGITGFIGKIVSKGAEFVLKLLSGIASVAGRIPGKAAEISGKFVRGVANGLVKLADTGAQAIIDFLNGLAKVVRERGKEIRAAGWNLADAIMDGMVEGLKEAYHRLPGPVKGMIGVITKTANKVAEIRSPSRVFHRMGGYIVQGLANGITASGSRAADSMSSTSNDVIRAAQNTLGNLSGVLPDVMEVDPVISPVLDLSQVRKEAGNMPDLGANVIPITAAASYGQASAISEEKALTDAALAEAVAASTKPTVEFNQTNSSPESLSEIEIYRQTNNALSKIKDVVGA